MKKIILLVTLFSLVGFAGCAQSASKEKPGSVTKSNERVGGPCEGCAAIHESPIPFEQLNSIDSLPDFNEEGTKIKISGVVYQPDGKTPAKDVVIYIYHTDQTGHYPTKGNEKGWGKRHGYLRGWIKTDKNGFYAFYTLRPAAYPGRKDPQHIHASIKEPNKNEYWIDDYVFNDDPLLNDNMRRRLENRGSDGILQLIEKNGIWYAERNIYLGKNIPHYPAASLKNIQSGLSIGSNCPAFDPLHISGIDVGKKACPMCKYGYGQGIMIWFNHTDLEGMNDFVKRLEKEMQQRGEKKFRVFLVYMNQQPEAVNSPEAKIVRQKIKEWCDRQNLQKVAVTWVPSPVDPETSGLYEINPEAMNTVFLYKKREVAAKWVNMEYSEKSLAAILSEL